MGFRENLKEELKYQDMRVKELSEKAGVSKRVIDHYLAEKCTEPTASAAVKIAKTLGVSVEYLVSENTISRKCSLSPAAECIVNLLPELSEKDIELVSEIVKRLQSQ